MRIRTRTTRRKTTVILTSRAAPPQAAGSQKGTKIKTTKIKRLLYTGFFGFETTFSAVPAQFSKVFVIFRRTNFWPTGNRIENGLFMHHD